MITEDYVSFETAKLLKEKGFDEPCIYVYRYDGSDDIWDADKEDIAYQKPTLQMAIKWLNTKGFHIFPSLEVDYDEDERGTKWYHDPVYYGEIFRIYDGKSMCDDGTLYATPELASAAAIKYCLENLL